MSALLKKKELINIIQNLTTFSSPKVQYEQYITDAVATADLIYYIAFEKQELIDRLVIDLGAGTGNLSIAAALVGAKQIIAVEIDADAITHFQANVTALNLQERIHIMQYDISDPHFPVAINEYIQSVFPSSQPSSPEITIITNPPFGVHHRGMDQIFLKQALAVPNVGVIYSIHLASPKSEQFLAPKIAKFGGIIAEKALLSLTIKHSYRFHTHRSRQIQTAVYRIFPQKEQHSSP